MIWFDNDDVAYLAWLESNPSGFVINCERNPKPAHLILHHATCKDISTSKRSNWTTHSYIKICSRDRRELEKWARRKTGGICKPCRCMKSPKHEQSQSSDVQQMAFTDLVN